MKNRIVFIISCLFFLHTCIINEDLPPEPNADFEFQIANDNSGKVNFRNTSLHASSYKWNFGDTDNPDNTSTEVTPTFTYTKGGIYTVTLTAIAFGSDTISKQIQIGDNSPPTDIFLDNNDQDTVLEQEPIGTLVGILTTIDPNPTDVHSYSLVTGPGDDNNNSFTINGDRLETAEIFNYVTKSSYSIRVRSVDDSGESIEKKFTIFIKEKVLNSPPTDILLDNNHQDTVLEKEPVGTLVGILTTIDPDPADVHSYSLVAGRGDDDNNSFTINGDRLETAEIFDYGIKSSYSIRVRSVDNNRGSIEKIFIIYIEERTSIIGNWVQTTASAGWAGRKEHAAVVFKDRMWVLGGLGSIGNKNDVWSSTDGINWTEETSAADWAPRNAHTAIVFDDGSGDKIWIMGGKDGVARFNDVWSSSDGINWTKVISPAPWDRRDDHTALVHKDRMWILGGRVTFNSQGENDIWWSINGITWNRVTPASAVWGTRFEHSAVIHNGRMYIAGGFGEPGTPGTHRNDVWSSNDGINWTEETSAADWEVRESHEMVHYHNKIWVFGGYKRIGIINSELRDMWNSTDGTNWTEVKPTVIWRPRQDYASVVYKDKIWVLGGGDSGTTLRLNDVWYYQE